MGQRNYIFDAFLLMSDGVTPITTAGITQVGGVNQIKDMLGAPTRTDIGIQTGGLARIDQAMVIDVSAISIANANNLYSIYVLGSNLATGANPVVLGSLVLGYGTGLPNGSHTVGGAPAGTGSDSYAGRYEILFSSEQADINYEFVYMWVVPVGTSPSITMRAFQSQLPEI